MRAEYLRVEYLKEPMGLGNRQPRFFWTCGDGENESEFTFQVKANPDGSYEKGQIKKALQPKRAEDVQSAYRIVAEELRPDSGLRPGEKLDSDGKTHPGETPHIIWDSGKVISSKMNGIPYEGESLKSRERVRWSVTLWDGKDVPGETVSAEFEMGLLKPSDWQASWIAGDYRPKKNVHYPADCFEKKFNTNGNKVVRARLYASARGLYNVILNGHMLDGQVMTPGITDYRKRIQYQTYDVTALIGEENDLRIQLADGWFRGSCAAYSVMDVYGTQTSVMAQLEVTFADGTTQMIVTDDSWKWSNDGPIRMADLKDGESVDARREPSFQGHAVVVKPPKALLVASDNVPVQMHEHFKAKLLHSKSGKRVLDFGQNLAGWVEFTVKAKAGQKLVLTLGEILDEDGNVSLRNVQDEKPVKGWNQISLLKKLLNKPLGGQTELTPKQKITFICKEGVNHYRTSFAVFGFRYAEVQSEMPIDPAHFESIAVYSSMEETGDFICSNELVNQLVRNTRWSMKSNFLDIPTDCPTRERLGWTGDAQIFFNTGAYFMNTAPFFAKWLRDMEDSQYKNGVLPAVLPYEGVEMMYKATGTSVGWADAVYLIPWRYYRRYGDERILKACWPMIRKYSGHLLSHTGLTDKKAAKANPYNEYTYEKGVHLGEWLEPEEFRDKVYGASAKHPEECTAYFHYSMTIIAEIADLMGEADYAGKLRKYAEGSKKAYNYLVVKNGLLDTDRQAKLVRPLALGLLNGEAKKKAELRLKEAVEHYHYRVGTGFLSTPFLLKVLCDTGFCDVAYKVLENEERPGWLSEVKAGATTVWENWEGNLSQNHYSPGAVCEWLFESCAGIRIDGPQHFVIAPVMDDSMEFVSASYRSIYGKVAVRWKKVPDGYEVRVTIPANTTAEIAL